MLHAPCGASLQADVQRCARQMTRHDRVEVWREDNVTGLQSSRMTRHGRVGLRRMSNGSSQGRPRRGEPCSMLHAGRHYRLMYSGLADCSKLRTGILPTLHCLEMQRQRLRQRQITVTFDSRGNILTGEIREEDSHP
ncbi:hypothetical protein J6590_034620 [Homalodisca vitripennis]|nr:hypothetical protein J6590_034620 [Homalodisca vitripennis]